MSNYTIDWSYTNVDGQNTVAGPEGNVTVSVSTPQNGQGKEWFVQDGMLKNWDVSSDSSADIRFSEAVENVSFTLFDVMRLTKLQSWRRTPTVTWLKSSSKKQAFMMLTAMS